MSFQSVLTRIPVSKTCRFVSEYLPALFLLLAAIPSSIHSQSTAAPTKGADVTAGVVIAHGRVIPGPYHFKYSDSKLFVNGVQLIPSPSSEKENEKLRALVKEDRRKLLNELGRVRVRARAMFDARRSHAEILQYVKSESAVIGDATWRGERVMLLRLAGDKDFMHMLEFRGLTQETLKQARETADPQELQRRLIDQYEKDLASGACLFFSSDNGVMRMDDPRGEVAAVMANKKLSDNERRDKILKLFPMNQTAASDVLENFSAGEWTRNQQ